ncbi:MAG: 50S ribosomal protein L33 [Planctomycetes bacterium]|nr:50S ribosomal protein L33 [Planctomycetota bacterium]
MREYVTLACNECKQRNYITSKETKGGKKLEIKKFCKFCRAHTKHLERKK